MWRSINRLVLFFKNIALLKVVLIMASGFAAANVAIVVMARTALPVQAPLNPFLEYADVFPGQPMAALQSRPVLCSSSNNYYNRPAEHLCGMDVDSPLFSRVEPVVLNGYITKTTFTLRDDTLKIGDLVLMLGAPRFGVYPRKTFLFWNNYFVMISTTATGHPPALRPVWSVTFSTAY